MPPPNRVIRGVTDIRTHSGTPDQVIVPYKAYMAITALEMEKFRRETERHNLTTRLNSVSAHLRRIDTEKAALLARLKKLPTPQGGARRVSNVNTLRSRPVGGFKFQY
jgi:hypothetical protein